MTDIQEFSNDSEDERAAEEEERKTLAASDSLIGLANSTPHRLKVKTYSEYVREVETKGEEILRLPCSGQNLSHIYKELIVGVAHCYATSLLKYSIGWRPQKDSIEKRSD